MPNKKSKLALTEGRLFFLIKPIIPPAAQSRASVEFACELPVGAMGERTMAFRLGLSHL
jgi:hypothetical protein